MDKRRKEGRRFRAAGSSPNRRAMLPPLSRDLTTIPTAPSVTRLGAERSFVRGGALTQPRYAMHDHSVTQRKLNRRLDHRFHELMDGASDEDDADDEDESGTNSKLHGGRSLDTPFDIFRSYDEFGERIKSPKMPQPKSLSDLPRVVPRRIVRGRDLSTTFLPAQSKKRKSLTSGEQRRPSFIRNRKLPLPGIAHNGVINGGNTPNRSEGADGITTQRETSVFTLTRPKELSSMNDGTVPTDRELEDLTDGSECEYENGVSPVATPILAAARPPTSWAKQAGVCEDERTSLVLSGKMSVKCSVHRRQVKLFLQSNPTDTEAEKGSLMQKVYPQLRGYCLARGYDLRVLDPYWGSRDLICDDHTDADLISSLVEEATEETDGLVNFITLMGQKYGPLMLPRKIPAKEFEDILAAMQADNQLLSAQDTNDDVTSQTQSQHSTNGNADSVFVINEKADIQQNHITPSAENSKNPKYSAQEEPRPKTGASIALTVPHRKAMSRENSNLDCATSAGTISVGSPGKRKLSAIMKEGGFVNRELLEPPDPGLITSWYKMDENLEPRMYRLQNISSHYKDIVKTDLSKKALARSAWQQTSRILQRLLFTYAQRTLPPDSPHLAKYHSSSCESDLTKGLLKSGKDPRVHCFWFKRELSEFGDTLGDSLMKDFIDLHPLQPIRDADLTQAWRLLTRDKLEKHIPFNNIRKYPLAWNSNGINPNTTRSHLVYIDRLCRDFYDILSKSFEVWYHKQPDISDPKTELLHDVEEHVHFCQERGLLMHGMKSALGAVKHYVRGESSHPFVVYGRSGCGKTAVMAKASQQAHSWLKSGNDVVTLVRVMGLTGESTNIRRLLRSLCLQLSYVFNRDPDSVQHDFKGLLNTFTYLLTMASAEKPITIFLLSLHKLSDENEARSMAWFPRDLPAHVKLIVSTLSDDKYDVFPSLKRCLPFTPVSDDPTGDEVFLEIPKMPIQDASAVLEHWYKLERRHVTDQQLHLLLKSFKSCPTPLYLRMIFKESLRWSSTFDVSEVKLGSAVKNMVTVMLGRLEKDHGEPLVRRAVGYITASRHGITSHELEDLLSLDEAVMDDLYHTLKLDMRRVPPLLVLRLNNELMEYLAESTTDDCCTLKWKHSQFEEAAAERYLYSRDKAPSYHKALAEYFMDMWSSRPKPTTNNAKGEYRFVTPQPLFRERTDAEGKVINRVYNKRRLNELPYHLIRSQQMDLLKAQCLCNFEFVLARICATSLRALFEDIQMALALESTDADLKLLSDTLHLSSSALLKDPKQLASQVVGRLQSIITKDVPVAPSDPVQFPAMKPFYKQALKGSVPAILPSITCLTPPGGILFDLLLGHSEPITALILSDDGQRAVTTSKDNTLKLWELRTGRVVKTINEVGTEVFQIRLAMNEIVVTSETSNIRIWNLQTGECLKRIPTNDPASITIANEGKTLVSFFHGATSMKSWKLLDNFPVELEANLSEIDEHPLSECIHQDNTTVVASKTVGPWVLHAFKDSSYAMVRNASTGNLVFKLQCKEAGAITALAMARDYFICAVRFRHKIIHEIYSLELFQVSNGQHFRSITGCMNDNINELHVNQIGSHAVAVCYSESSRASDIAVWNLETEEHKHLAKHASVSKFAACVDLRCLLTGSEEENSLRMWNLSGKVNQPVPKEKPKEGIEQLIPLKDHTRYIMAKSTNNGPLVLWNILKKKLAGIVMRSIHGLAESTDTVLLSNTKLIILAEKGFSKVSGDDQPIYQAVVIYDLVEQQFTGKLTGCYIFPSPAHEYAILNDTHLLGLSDNRNHFVVWSLSTGHIVYRIKTNFRHPDRVKPEVTNADKSDTNSEGQLQHQQTSRPKRSDSRVGKKRKQQADDEREHLSQEELQKEKDNAIEEYLISKDFSLIVAAFYAHHLCVFDVPSQTHIQTLENPTSLMLLHVAALTPTGDHLVHSNYDDHDKTSYITLWSCRSGEIKRRLRNEKNVHAIAINDDASRVVFGKANKELRIWDPFRKTSQRKIKGYPSLEFGVGSQIRIVDNGARAVVFTGDISIWDLESAAVLAVFTPDTKINAFSVAMDGNLIMIGMRDKSEIVSLRLAIRDAESFERCGQYLFDEVDSSDDDSDDDQGADEGSDDDDYDP